MVKTTRSERCLGTFPFRDNRAENLSRHLISSHLISEDTYFTFGHWQLRPFRCRSCIVTRDGSSRVQGTITQTGKTSCGSPWHFLRWSRYEKKARVSTWREHSSASPAIWTRPLQTRCPWRPPSRCGFPRSHPQASPSRQVCDANQRHTEAS